MILSVCPNPSVDAFWSFSTLRKATVNRSSAESYYPGGKGVHTALALNELGETVRLLGIWGGATGRWIREECRKNVAVAGPETDGWNRLCITNRSEGEWDRTELRGAGPAVTEQEAGEFLDAYRRELDRHAPKAIVAGGSLPAGLQEECYATMTRLADGRGIPVFLDTSGAPLRAALETLPFCIHLNREEAGKLTGRKDPVSMARQLGKKCRLAAVTDGERGLYLFFEGKVHHARHEIDPEEFVSPVGAGDCLLAGLCLAVLREEDPYGWARMAVASGSANCVNPALGMLNAEDVQRFQPEVTVRTYD